MSRRIHVFDTTLRDGQQTSGVDFSVADKVALTEALDQLGIDYIEGGWPGANPTDDQFFNAPPPLNHARLVAFGMTRRPGRSAANDPGLAPLLNSSASAICLVGKSSEFQVKTALDIPLDENLAMISDSIAEIKRRDKEALYDAEHFFDGYKANPDYTIQCLKAAYDQGARWIVLCDTNGGTLPHEITEIVQDITKHIPGEQLGIHTHNDTENAVANSLAAINAGVHQVQGTINGLGERCGNANLISILPSLIIKMGHSTGVSRDQLQNLRKLSHLLDDRLNHDHDHRRAYVGDYAFTHKGGLHVSAVARDPRCYEHIEPHLVGNKRNIVISDQAGRANIEARLHELNITDLSKDKLMRILDEVKTREFQGYSYDGADASFENLTYRSIGELEDYFKVTRFRVMDERRMNAKGQMTTESEATVTLKIGGQETMRVAMGNGPVNALDSALRGALIEKWPELKSLHLIDYKVRIISPRDDSIGTDAITRVTIESSAPESSITGNDSNKIIRWRTVGASTNIIEASMEALTDSCIYFLAKSNQKN